MPEEPEHDHDPDRMVMDITEAAALAAYRQWDADADLDEREALDAFAAHGGELWTLKRSPDRRVSLRTQR